MKVDSDPEVLIGLWRWPPCRGAEASPMVPFTIEVLQLQYIDKVVDVCCACPTVPGCSCREDSRAPTVAPR